MFCIEFCLSTINIFWQNLHFTLNTEYNFHTNIFYFLVNSLLFFYNYIKTISTTIHIFKSIGDMQMYLMCLYVYFNRKSKKSNKLSLFGCYRKVAKWKYFNTQTKITYSLLQRMWFKSTAAPFYLEFDKKVQSTVVQRKFSDD